MTEKPFDLLPAHVPRVAPVVKSDILKYPSYLGFFSAEGIMMIAKNFPDLVHQAGGLRLEAAFHDSLSLCFVSVYYYPDIRVIGRIIANIYPNNR